MLHEENLPNTTALGKGVQNMNLIKLAVAAGTVLMSAGAWAQPIDCAIFINGKNIRQVESSDSSTLTFRDGNYEIYARPQAENSRRVKVTIQSTGSTKGAYLIGAFRNGKLRMSPEIYGQQMSVSCIQK